MPALTRTTYRPAWYPDDLPAPFLSNGQTGGAEASRYEEWCRGIPDLPAVIRACSRGEMFCGKCGNVDQAEFGDRDRCLFCAARGIRRSQEFLDRLGVVRRD